MSNLALSFAVSWSINWYFIFGKQFGNFYQNAIKYYQNTSFGTAIPFLGISIQKLTYTYAEMQGWLLRYSLKQEKSGNSLNAHQQKQII